jgi:hypothetical protein
MLHLEKSQVPAHLRNGYTGTKFRADPKETVYIPSDAGLWSHGSRTTYHAIELATGREVPLPNQELAPWDAGRTERKVTLKPGFAIVQAIMFQGKDLGLTFHVHPDDVVKLIPQNTTAALEPVELKFLAIMRGIKSSYRADEYRRQGMTDAQIAAFKVKFTDMGYINKQGAITVQGKNDAGDTRPY